MAPPTTDDEEPVGSRIHNIILEHYPGSIIFNELKNGYHWSFTLNGLLSDQEMRDEINEEIIEFQEYDHAAILGWYVTPPDPNVAPDVFTVLVYDQIRCQNETALLLAEFDAQPTALSFYSMPGVFTHWQNSQFEAQPTTTLSFYSTPGVIMIEAQIGTN